MGTGMQQKNGPALNERNGHTGFRSKFLAETENQPRETIPAPPCLPMLSPLCPNFFAGRAFVWRIGSVSLDFALLS